MKTQMFTATAALSILIALTAVSARAAENNQRFDIQAQSLSSALMLFSQQSSVVVVAPSELVKGKSAPAISGEMSPSAAMEQLLRGSGLAFKRGADGQIMIMHKGSLARTGERTVISQAGQAMQHVGENKKTSASNPDRDADSTDTKGVPEILVEGRRSVNADIRRTEDDPQPYVVFEREEIERSMAGSVQDFLKTRLPMNAVQRNNSQANGRFGNQSSIDLRGLGTNQTLVLVNGRRMPRIIDGVQGLNDFNQPDINGIPLASIERIEVLPSTASGIYGGGATGGVVNIILRRNYTGAELTAGYNNTFSSDMPQSRFDGSVGFTLEEGKTSILLNGSYASSGRLLVGERDFSARARALQMKNDPAAINSRTFSLVRGATPNFRSATTANLVLLNGITLSSTQTHSPYGYAGWRSDNGAALAANAGRLNFDLPRDAGGLGQSLINNPVVQSGGLSVRRSFGEHLEIFMDGSVFGNYGQSTITLFDGDITLQPGDPRNPFQNRVFVTFETPETESTFRTKTVSMQGAAGLIWRLPHQWSAQGEYGWGRSRFKYGSTRLNTAGTTALNNGTIDISRDASAYPYDFTNLLAPDPSSIFGPQDLLLKTVSLRVGGPVLRLPGGPLSLTAVVERRTEESKDNFARFLDDNGVVAQVVFNPHRAQNVDSAYVEVQVPIVSQSRALPFVNDLQLQISARRDRYRTDTTDGLRFAASEDGPFAPSVRAVNRGASTDLTFGVRYSPIRDIALRASYGTGFLPPSLSQLFSNTIPSLTLTGNDPKRKGEFFSYRAAYFYGGNAHLTPEDSRSFSAGAIYTPTALPGLRVSLDYTRIRKTREIVTLGLQDMLNNEDAMSERFVRAPLSDADRAAGYGAGLITALDNSLINIAGTKIEAFDLQLDHTRGFGSLGSINFYALITHQPHFNRQILPTTPVVDAAGYNLGALRWRGNGGFTWDRDNWSAGWNAQYYHHYIAYAAGSTPFFINAVVSRQGTDTIPGQIYHDLFARYKFTQTQGMFAGVELTGSIQNVFDTLPPIVAGSDAFGGYSYYGDPRMRRYALMLRKAF